MRLIYSCLLYILLPVLFLRLYWRGFKVPAFRHRWSERLAWYKQPHAQQVIFFHAVSVGEVESIFPLVNQLLQQQAGKILITTTTPTASARIQQVMGNRVEHVYLPYDVPILIQRFLKHFQPKLAVIVETEIWPNLFAACAKKAIPLFIINARLSEASYKGYQKLAALTKPALNAVTLIATQTPEDTQRFIAFIAAHKVQTFGNIKFDIQPSHELITAGQRLRLQVFAGRFVWIIASTHKEEELIFLTIYQQLKQKIPQLLLLIVPRNMERFPEVKRLCEKQHLQVVMRTSGQICKAETDVYIADTMGELKMLYAVADVAFVGGSMVEVGGHNILEPAALGIPVMFGPYMANFKAIAAGVLTAQAALQCQNPQQISETLLLLYQQPEYRQLLADAGRAFVRQNQGVIEKIVLLLVSQTISSNSSIGDLKKP
jgi:3-deoxy-D-manno-octulosonic-acid transferase